MGTDRKKSTAARRDLDTVDHGTPEIAASPVAPAKEPIPRLGAPLTGKELESADVDWERVRHPEKLQAFFLRQGKKLGLVERESDQAVRADDSLNAAQLFTLANVIAQAVALRFTHCTPEQAAILGVSEKQLAELNKNGITDRMIEKYLGTVAAGLEITWCMTLLGVATQNYQQFQEARRLDAARAPAGRVIQMPPSAAPITSAAPQF